MSDFKQPLIKPSDSNMRRRLQRRERRGKVMRPLWGLYAFADDWNRLNPWQKQLSKICMVAGMHLHWPLANVSAAAVLGATCDGRNGPKYLEHVHFVADDKTSTAHRKRLPVRFHYAKFSRPKEIFAMIKTQRIYANAIISQDERSIAKSYTPINSYIGIAHGILVTSPLQTIFDCMRRLPFEDALKICDRLAAIYHITYHDLVEFIFLRHGCWFNIPTLFKMKFVDRRSDNGGESFCRGRMIRGGLQAPIVQKEFKNCLLRLPADAGATLQRTDTIRPDFAWGVSSSDGGFRYIAAELDGRAKYVNRAMISQVGATDSIDVLMREKDRENIFAFLGIPVVRFQFREAYMNNGENMLMKLRMIGVPEASEGEKQNRRGLLADCLGHPTLMML
ncbi:hypothetical protein EJ419_00540 [Alloscardovia theropitheci]|uniref:Uncharacterized protein n=1 Tax=Alloscardovia theropitheci TaxID=2496842 RepID=A0A4R0QWT2_9BIFI|nr:hypothetical protein [Alloscardovia theropitheci]TCD54917.1 hypothetical protein EJ419_00540 [Alloscardovia theropitheci]